MATIKEDYVSFETAKLLKEKGFLIPSTNFEDWVFCMYDENGDIQWGCYSSEWYVRVTLQMAIKWLMKKHNICIVSLPVVTDDDGEGGCLWKYTISMKLKVLFDSGNLYESPEIALSDGLKYALENLIHEN